MPFNANETFEYAGHQFIVPAERDGVNRPYEAEGGKAIVTRVLRIQDQSLWAVKEFRKKYRTPEQQKAAIRLETVRKLPGLQAAQQFVIQGDSPLAQQKDSLRWAVMMPWVEGDTWGTLLKMVQLGKRTHTRPEAEALAIQILEILIALEFRQIVHCDISGGNVIRQKTAGQYRGFELIDLEDMFIKGEKPANYTGGTPGYALPGNDRTDCVEGDRYSGAILITEALALGLPYAKDLANSEGMFRQGNRKEPKAAQEQYNYISCELRKTWPKFVPLLDQAWNAKSLSDCPPLSDLYRSLTAQPSAGTTDDGSRWGDRRIPGIPTVPPLNVPPMPFGSQGQTNAPPPPPNPGGLFNQGPIQQQTQTTAAPSKNPPQQQTQTTVGPSKNPPQQAGLPTQGKVPPRWISISLALTLPITLILCLAAGEGAARSVVILVGLGIFGLLVYALNKAKT